MKRVFKVHAEWKMNAIVEQEAESLADAVAIVRTMPLPTLPADAEYVGGSFNASLEDSVGLNDESTEEGTNAG